MLEMVDNLRSERGNPPRRPLSLTDYDERVLAEGHLVSRYF
jgi:hypothetical protein